MRCRCRVPECYCMARGRGRRGPAAHATAQRPPLSRHISLETRGFVMLYSYFHPCLLISTAVGPWWFGGAARPRGRGSRGRVASRAPRGRAGGVASLERRSGGAGGGWLVPRACCVACVRANPTGADRRGPARDRARRRRAGSRARAAGRVCYVCVDLG